MLVSHHHTETLITDFFRKFQITRDQDKLGQNDVKNEFYVSLSEPFLYPHLILCMKE